MKSVFKLSGFIVIMAVFSACFSPWAGDPGVVTIDFGDGGNAEEQGNTARSAVTAAEAQTLTHIITLYGNGTPVTARLVGAGTISITVLQGSWNIRVRAESPEPAQTLRALGFGQVQVRAGRSTPAVIDMISATEVSNHAQLAAAISGARNDGLEKIIVLTQDIEVASQLTIGTDRNITLASDSDVAIRRGAGIAPNADIFSASGLTPRLGREGLSGSVYVEATPPPAYYTRGLEIRGNALYGRGIVPPTVTDIVIPHGVTSIENDAFSGDNLTSVTIPNTVRIIGLFAFLDNNLTNVTIPDSVTSIGLAAFHGNNLTSVTIPTNIRYIGNSAFSENRLISVNIPDSVTIIESGAFRANYLVNVTIPNNTTYIGNSAFAANRLNSVNIPNNITYIGESAFANNYLTNVIIPYSVLSIGPWAFAWNNLTSVTIPFANLDAADAVWGDEWGGTGWRNEIPAGVMWVYAPQP